MSSEQDDWHDLQQSWQRQSPDLVAPAALKAAVRRGQWRMAWDALAEALVALGSAAIFAYWAQTASGWTALVFWGLAAVSLATPLVTLGLRMAVWRGHGATVADWRDQLRRQARLGLLLARLGYLGGPLGLGIGLLVGYNGDLSGLDRPWTRSVVAPAAVTILILGWFWSLREARRHQRALQNLADAEGEREAEV